MITVSSNKLLLPLLLILGLFFLMVLGAALYEVRRENLSLRRALEMVEQGAEEEREEAQGQVDSLQKRIEEQEVMNIFLKETILELEGSRERINMEADEKTRIILGIAAVDSLRNEVARHYRR